jgi:hypothetical protein
LSRGRSRKGSSTKVNGETHSGNFLYVTSIRYKTVYNSLTFSKKHMWSTPRVFYQKNGVLRPKTCSPKNLKPTHIKKVPIFFCFLFFVSKFFLEKVQQQNDPQDHPPTLSFSFSQAQSPLSFLFPWSTLRSCVSFSFFINISLSAHSHSTFHFTHPFILSSIPTPDSEFGSLVLCPAVPAHLTHTYTYTYIHIYIQTYYIVTL